MRKQLGLRRAADLVVLEPKNDPFYSGTPTDIAEARWFADLWIRFGFAEAGAHLRRVHYRVLSAAFQHPTADRLYCNDQNDWETLNRASRHARYQRLIDPEKVLDARNGRVAENVWPLSRDDDPGVILDEFTWELPQFATGTPRLAMPTLTVAGYEYDPSDQAVLLEVWIEKSTMNDVLGPLCQRLHVNLMTGTGYQSLANIQALVRRVQASGRPAHILYISDWDPAGDNMPRQVSRQAEFWIEKLRDVPRLTLQPLVLTRDQIDEFNLPVMFDKHLSGAVELDALEAFRPGELARIVTRAIGEWRDAELPSRLAAAETEAQDTAGEFWGDQNADLHERLAAINDRVAAIMERHQPAIEALNSELDQVRRDLAALEDDVQHRFDETEMDLPDRPEAEEPAFDADEMLFDSGRHWLEQLNYYREHKLGRCG